MSNETIVALVAAVVGGWVLGQLVLGPLLLGAIDAIGWWVAERTRRDD